MTRRWRHVIVGLVLAASGAAATAQTAAPITYVVTCPEPEHHWIQIEARFPGVGTAPLDVHMSRASPGRYAVHEFAKNVFAFAAYDGQNHALAISKPEADVWRVAGHDGTVRVVYRIFGDYADGTYLGIDTTHEHLNMPAAFVWAAGLDERPIAITFTPPPGSDWRAGTQLYPTPDPLRFTAPNLQYFMDSPTEIGPLVTSTFDLPNADGTPAHFRIMVHGDATQADVDAFAALVARLVREEMAVFGEFPRYEPGQYTFLLDLVPWVHGDAMEHRNSTYISTPGASLRTAGGRRAVLDSLAHEFFHNWNVERIRPAGLEPFDFTRENVTCCLWLAEGFTQYYGELLRVRAGLSTMVPLGYGLLVANSPARAIRSAVDMSEQAPFADAAVANDVDDRSRTYLSYYDEGAGIALGLDLTLRERSDGRLSLDDYMRRLWREFGAPVDPRPGYVTRPYTLADLRRVLANLTGDAAFAGDFFDRYVEGHAALDYPRLFAAVGFTIGSAARTDAGWIGDASVLPDVDGLVLPSGEDERLVTFSSPLYAAGVDAGDRIVSIDGEPATLDRWTALARRHPGDRVTLVVERRDGRRVTTAMVVGADRRLRTVQPAANPSAAAIALRDGWLRSRVAG